MGGQCVVRTATIVGVRAVPVDVEIDVGAGIPYFGIVGLADAAIHEARERVRSALRSSGFEVPNARIVVNLAPAPLRKHGTGFDLPIALGILVATGQLPRTLVNGVMAVGELSLDGSVRPVPGLLAHAIAAREAHLDLLAPAHDLTSAFGDDLKGLPLETLSALRQGLPERRGVIACRSPHTHTMDYAEVVGQDFAIRAMLIAAAGAHNCLMVGPPGSGKTMLARRLPSILPPLGDAECLESALVHSVGGLDTGPTLSGVRPFRAPHHSASIAGLVGGGSPPRPGEVSLAHNGVLFLDEISEYGSAALQCLRQPMEDGRVVIVRADGSTEFPARFSLVGASNPCPCGFLGDPARPCGCAPGAVERYRAKLGGPLLDRFDMQVTVERPDPSLLLGARGGTSSSELRDQVSRAHLHAGSVGRDPSARLSGTDLMHACELDAPSRRVLELVARAKHLSGRALTRLLRVARTIADIEQAHRVRSEHLEEALLFRHHQGGLS